MPNSRDGRRGAKLGVLAAALIASQVAGKTVRDAFFLSEISAEKLPIVMGASAILALVSSVVIGRAASRWSPQRVFPVALLLHASLLAGEWVLSATAPAVAAWILYLHMGALAALLVSTFWSFVVESFDPHSAKRAIAGIGTAASLGGLMGGVVAWKLADLVSIPDMLLGLAGAYLALGAGTALLYSKQSPNSWQDAASTRAPEESGFEVLRKTPYLRMLGALVVVAAIGEAGLDYLFKASAAAQLSDASALVSFFAVFNTCASIFTLLLQAGFSRRLIERVGISGAVAGLPATLLTGCLAVLAMPGLAALTLLRGAALSVENSIYRSGYELFYTPLAPAKKRLTKSLIDVGGDKLGAALGSAIALLVVTFAMPAAREILLCVVIASALASLLIARSLHRGYVSELAAGVEAGLIHRDSIGLTDATTRQTISDKMSLDRRELLAQVEAMHHPVQRDRPGTVSSDAAAALRSGDIARIRAELNDERPLDSSLVGDVLPLLARDDLAPSAVSALRRIAEVATAPIVRALVTPGTDPRIRRRIPRVLTVLKTQAGVDGLLAALRDPVFEVRYRSAAALMLVTASGAGLRIDRPMVLAAMSKGANPGSVPGSSERSEEQIPTVFEDNATSRRLGRNLTYVFTLLSLLIEREPLHLAFVSLGSSDLRLRGTAREWLDSVIPIEVRAALAPLLDDHATASRIRRPRRQVFEDLMATRDDLILDRAALEKLRDK